jgi:hypothetical protein
MGYERRPETQWFDMEQGPSIENERQRLRLQLELSGETVLRQTCSIHRNQDTGRAIFWPDCHSFDRRIWLRAVWPCLIDNSEYSNPLCLAKQPHFSKRKIYFSRKS